MIKNFLTVALAVTLCGSAFAFGPKRVVPTGDKFTVVPQLQTSQKHEKMATRAAEDVKSFDFTYAEEVYSATSINPQYTPENTVIYQCFYVPAETATAFAGDKITSVNITTGAVVKNNTPYPNDLTSVNVFITYDKDKEPVYSQTGKLGTDYLTEYSVPLDTPFEIEGGKGFYVGYSFTLKNSDLWYIAFDGMQPFEDNSWLGYKTPNAKSISWLQTGPDLGSLCIGCTIEGENWPADRASIIDMAAPSYTSPGVPFEVLVLLKANAMDVKSIELSYTVGDATPVTESITFETPLNYTDYDILSIQDVVCDVESLEQPIEIRLTKVNGVDVNTSVGTVVATTFSCYSADKGFPRVSLVEEGTGTWCGWCPLGIVMMEYIKEKYPENFALVAIHGDGSTKDPMTVSSTQSWINSYAAGFPYAIMNRSEEVVLSNVASVYEQIDEYVKNDGKIPAILGIDAINASIDETGKMTVSADVKCNLDLSNNNRYRMNYYVTQDGMGPYKQTNYYAAAYGQNMECAGWEKKAASVNMLYNEVARVLSGGMTGLSGISNSLPNKFEAGVDCTTSETSINVSSVKAEKFNVVAFITDRSNGEVVNAKTVSVDNSYYLAGVDEIAATDADVVSKKYYNMNGVEVKDPSNGIFVVRSVYTDGTVKAEKVVVK